MRAARLVAVACAIAIAPAAGCGRDSSSLSAEYCAAVEKVFLYDNGLHGEEDPALARAAYAKSLRNLGRALTTIEEDGPEEAQRAGRALRALYTESREKGTDPFEGEIRQSSTLVRASSEGCGWPEAPITAADYTFNAPTEVKPGTVALRLANHSHAEAHLFLLMRVKDGVTKPLDDLYLQFRGPETAPDADVEFLDGGVFTFPGQTSFGLVKLTPGRYVYLCPLPVTGGASEDDDHMRRGMRGEFEVRS